MKFKLWVLKVSLLALLCVNVFNIALLRRQQRTIAEMTELNHRALTLAQRCGSQSGVSYEPRWSFKEKGNHENHN
jgi:hypothetical protein